MSKHLSKKRKLEIKSSLYDYSKKIMLLNLYREKKRLNLLNEKELETYTNLLNQIGHLEIGIKTLTYENDKQIFEYLFINKYSITKTAIELNYSESGIIKRMNCILKHLDEYI